MDAFRDQSTNDMRRRYPAIRRSFTTLLGLSLLAWTWDHPTPLPAQSTTPTNSTSSQQEVDAEAVWKLVDRLGSPNYLEREDARKRLLRMRNEAYDVLLEASRHDQAEIRLSIRSILSQMKIDWLRPSDPPAVTGRLNHYADQSIHVRKSLIHEVARLPEAQDCWILTRLVRFESSDLLSKWAAILLMKQGTQLPEHNYAEWSSQLHKELRGSRRDAAHWLRTFTQNESPFDANDKLDGLISAELNQLAQAGNINELESDFGLALARWYATLKLQQQPPADVSELTETMSWLIADGEPAAKEHLDWLATHHLWPNIVAWGQSHDEVSDNWAEVRYRLAEAYRQLGQTELSDRQAELAREALPNGLEDSETLAHVLETHGYVHWAIDVLKHTLAQSDAGTGAEWRIRIDLANWLEDQWRWNEAVEVLKTGIETADSRSDGWNGMTNQQAKTRLRCQAMRLEAISLLSPAPTTDSAWKEAKELLDRARDGCPDNVQLAILHEQLASIHHPNDRLDRRTIDRYVGQLYDRIRMANEDLNRSPLPNVKLELETDLSQWSCDLAQLLLASDGDLSEAQRHCETACQLRPHTPQPWETLGMILEAQGDLTAAQDAMRKALRQRPQSIRLQQHVARINRLNKTKLETSQR